MALTQKGRCGNCKFWEIKPNCNRHGCSNSFNWNNCLKGKKPYADTDMVMRFDFCEEFIHYETNEPYIETD